MGDAMTQPDVRSSLPVEWQGGLSAQAQTELTQLLVECAGICRGQLQTFQPVRPFLLARRRRDGGFSFSGGDFMPSAVDDPISYLYEMLHRTAAHYTALAVVHDAQTDGAPLMSIYFEHVEGEAFRVWVPWRRLGDDNVRLEPPVIRPTQPLIWSNSR
jgi:hypothetical protein